MKEKALLVTGVLAALLGACGSKTSIATGRDGAAAGTGGSGGASSPDAPTGSGGWVSLGSGGMVGGATGSGGLATGSGGTGGKTSTGGMGTGGQPRDAGAIVDAVGADGRPSIDGAIDAARDAATDMAAPNCALVSGFCSELSNGCATCPNGSVPSASRLDCPSQSWCCTPLPTVTDECSAIGGTCVSGLDRACPAGWRDVWTSCRDTNSKCCMPKPEICNTVPKPCAAIGGICALSRWSRCPAGTEPYSTSSNQLGCEVYNDGWCCVDAPPSPCADSAKGGMCVPGAQCTGCFTAHEDPAMTCEAGRVCCVDICD